MLTELGKRVDENRILTKNQKIYFKKRTSQLKTTIIEIKNTVEWINGKLGDIEECTGDLEDRIIEITRSEQQKEKPILKWKTV